MPRRWNPEYISYPGDQNRVDLEIQQDHVATLLTFAQVIATHEPLPVVEYSLSIVDKPGKIIAVHGVEYNLEEIVPGKRRLLDRSAWSLLQALLTSRNQSVNFAKYLGKAVGSTEELQAITAVMRLNKALAPLAGILGTQAYPVVEKSGSGNNSVLSIDWVQ